MDSINGIPALDDLDPAALVGQYSRDLRTGLFAPTGPMYDTGPMTVPKITGFGGAELRIRRLGYTVQIYSVGNVTGTVPTGLVELVAAGNVPAGLRPPSNRWGSVFLSGNTTASAVARAEGSVALVNDTGSTRSSFQLTITWFVGGE